MVWLLVILLATGVAMLRLAQEAPIIPNGIREAYDIQDIVAPALAGWPMTLFAYLSTQTMLRPFVMRHFLNVNGLNLVRQLASSLPYIPPTHYPMSRLNEQDYNKHVEAAATSQFQDVLQHGFPISGAAAVGGNTNQGYRSILDYHQLYEEGKATPSVVMEKVLQGYDKLSHLHIFSSILGDDVRKQAKESDQRYKEGRPLSVFDGVPIAFKDSYSVVGHKVCSGSRVCPVAERDDEVVTTFRQAGAIIFGLTVMTEGGVTPLGYNVWFDGPFNPFDTNYYSGGSSSGSAVAVATGLVPLAVGMDGGGSIRIPAAMTGTVGLAPTFGRVQVDAERGSTMVKTGPIAATVQDAALGHMLMGQVPNKEHFYAKLYDGGVRGPPPAHLNGFLNTIKGMRLGIYWDHFKHTDPEVVDKCVQVLEFLKLQGADIVNITIPYLRQLHLSHAMKISSEFARRWDAEFYNSTVELEKNTRLTCSLGKAFTASELLAADKLRSWGMETVRTKIFRDQKIDAILSPTIGTKVPKPKPGYRTTGENNNPLVLRVMRFAPLANFLGLPAISVPVGYEQETGLPIGFQILGDAWMEHTVLQIAGAIETGFVKRQRPRENYFDPLAEWLGPPALLVETSTK